ncbi:MAG TPA: MFS transporter [Pseudomonadales bacterium]|nr:MFS transporter [Pseudomonadales bacterium]
MNPRLALLLSSLYIAQGLPSGFFAHALPALLREHGVSLTLIGLAKLLALPWFFKFLWASAIDRIGAGKHNHYRRWILLMQSIGLLTLTALSLLHPENWFSTNLPWFLLAALLINTCLATQDIATDALAVKMLSVQQRGLGNSIQVAGYKLGMLAGGNGLLILMASVGLQNGFRWLAAGLLLLMIPVWFFREPVAEKSVVQKPAEQKPHANLWQEWQPLFTLPGMPLWLPVLLTYKIADSMASGMIRPLLVDSGFSLEHIGQVGMVASITGMLAAFVGGLCERWLGGWRALFWFGVLQALGLAAWALVPLGWNNDSAVFSIAIFEQMADAMSTVALFAGMMGFCRAGHEGGDYTVQMSLFMIASGTLGLAGGAIAEQLGAPSFFLAMGGLALLCLGWVARAMRASDAISVNAPG